MTPMQAGGEMAGEPDGQLPTRTRRLSPPVQAHLISLTAVVHPLPGQHADRDGSVNGMTTSPRTSFFLEVLSREGEARAQQALRTARDQEHHAVAQRIRRSPSPRPPESFPGAKVATGSPTLRRSRQVEREEEGMPTAGRVERRRAPAAGSRTPAPSVLVPTTRDSAPPSPAAAASRRLRAVTRRAPVMRACVWRRSGGIRRPPN